MRTEARVESEIIFEHYDCGFDRIERCAAARQYAPAGFEAAAAARAAVFDRAVRDIPRAAVNDERWLQERIGESVTRPEKEAA